jgi:hypothetical protein
MDWGQVALFAVIIVVLYLVGRFLRARGYVGTEAGMATEMVTAAGTETEVTKGDTAIW